MVKKPRKEPKQKREFRWLIEEHLDRLDIPRHELIPEFRPLRDREFRVDFALPNLRLAFEYEGVNPGYSGKSRHTTITGYSNDCEKYTWITAVIGWRLVRVTPVMVRDGRAGPLIRGAIDAALNPEKAHERHARPFSAADMAEQHTLALGGTK